MARYQNSNETDSVKNDSNVTEEMTEIIEYKQTYIPDEKRTGDCWTSSIAASTNETAYRCNVGEHQIIDPCFKTEDARVVCDVDPERQGSGFELELTKDLPPREDSPVSENWLPWLAKLANGGYCRVYTGTAFRDKDGKYYYLYCYDSANKHIGNGDLDKNGNPWKVNLIIANNEQNDFITETVDVIKVWK